MTTFFFECWSFCPCRDSHTPFATNTRQTKLFHQLIHTLCDFWPCDMQKNMLKLITWWGASDASLSGSQKASSHCAMQTNASEAKLKSDQVDQNGKFPTMVVTKQLLRASFYSQRSLCLVHTFIISLHGDFVAGRIQLLWHSKWLLCSWNWNTESETHSYKHWKGLASIFHKKGFLH